MKTAIALLLLVAALTGCQSRTAYGECIGIVGERDTTLRYNLSVRNAVVGIVFVEMIVPPIVVLANETLCPVGRK